MQVKSIQKCSKRAFCNTFDLKLPFGNKIFVLSIFEWLFYTGFTSEVTGLNLVLAFIYIHTLCMRAGLVIRTDLLKTLLLADVIRKY